jgi:biotin carboxyl carrier protein
MMVQLHSKDLNDTHTVPNVTVYSGEAAAVKYQADKPQEETIAFLKEQQWSLDFATAPIAERAERESFVVSGEVQPRSGGQGEVSAPLDGRLVDVVAVPVGETVTRGQILARIAPPTSRPPRPRARQERSGKFAAICAP